MTWNPRTIFQPKSHAEIDLNLPRKTFLHLIEIGVIPVLKVGQRGYIDVETARQRINEHALQMHEIEQMDASPDD